jgi:hypothetical protein
VNGLRLTGSLALHEWSPGRTAYGDAVFISAAPQDVIFISAHAAPARQRSLEAVA